MATLADLVQEHTHLPEAVISHLQRLVGGWGVLSDLSFADLLLFVPVEGPNPSKTGEGGRPSFVVAGQIRPTNSQTLHLDDLVGRVVTAEERPAVARAWEIGSVVEGEVSVPSRGEPGRSVAIPVRWQGELVAIMARESAISVGRRPGMLERTYIEVFDRMARMISRGEFPFPIDETIKYETPRVGDGVMVLDATARADFASPNAVNALHRLGIYSGIEGVRLDEAGLNQAAISLSFQTKLPVVEEVGDAERSVVIRCIPLLDTGSVTGALVLLRDVSDLRSRDRLLMSKDAAIREVHHRVKNNLQTISSLLRIQSRRMPPGDAQHALQESERRVRSIALVHEILSRDTTDEVDFNDILPSLVRMAEDMGTSDRPVRIHSEGAAGRLQASVATPLAVVINELLQNAAEHGFPEGSDDPPPGREDETLPGTRSEPLTVSIALDRRDGLLQVEVGDNGVGFAPEFSIDTTSTLGLSIVRGLVGSQLGGSISIRNGDEGGAVVQLSVPLHPHDEDLVNL